MSDRDLLARLCQGPASGQDLAVRLGLSRSAVWKRIEALRGAGVVITAAPGRGYALAQPLELLEVELIGERLSDSARAELAGLDLRFEIDSSNALALREPAPLRGAQVFLCERQTAGRGRRGRAWQSPLAAHLYLTVSRRFEISLAGLHGLSLAVGVAVADALIGLGYTEVGLKWPNDLVVRERGAEASTLRKLGGILIEVGGEATGPVRAAIGIGLNIAMPSEGAAAIDQPWCDLASLAEGRAPSRNHVCAALLNQLLPALAEFERTGFSRFLPAWQRLDALAGHDVQVVEREQSQRGRALGVAADGALRVDHDGVERRYHGGEVSLRRA